MSPFRPTSRPSRRRRPRTLAISLRHHSSRTSTPACQSPTPFRACRLRPRPSSRACSAAGVQSTTPRPASRRLIRPRASGPCSSARGWRRSQWQPSRRRRMSLDRRCPRRRRGRRPRSRTGPSLPGRRRRRPATRRSADSRVSFISTRSSSASGSGSSSTARLALLARRAGSSSDPAAAIDRPPCSHTVRATAYPRSPAYYHIPRPSYTMPFHSGSPVCGSISRSVHEMS